jgi:hypothetical protein
MEVHMRARTLAVIAAVMAGAGTAMAQGITRYEPGSGVRLETRQDAWQRQQAEQYQWRRENPYVINPGTMERLGDPPIQPSAREQWDWGLGAPDEPLGGGRR